jgi:hypothetical protein
MSMGHPDTSHTLSAAAKRGDSLHLDCLLDYLWAGLNPQQAAAMWMDICVTGQMIHENSKPPGLMSFEFKTGLTHGEALKQLEEMQRLLDEWDTTEHTPEP